MAEPVSRVSAVLMRGPLASFADEFRNELLARGYTARTAVNQLRFQPSRVHGLRGVVAVIVGGVDGLPVNGDHGPVR